MKEFRKKLLKQFLRSKCRIKCNITDNVPGGDNCPNSGPETSATELMESMINQIPIEKPSQSWADKTENNELSVD